jgi:hypothetical protein
MRLIVARCEVAYSGITAVTRIDDRGRTPATRVLEAPVASVLPALAYAETGCVKLVSGLRLTEGLRLGAQQAAALLGKREAGRSVRWELPRRRCG